MSLIIPGPSWANCTTNLSGTPSVSALGTTVTAAGSANADGTSVALITNLSHDCELLVISIAGLNTSATNTSGLLDILIDPAGGTTWNTNPLINDLLAGYTPSVGVTGSPLGARNYYFPIWIKSGTSIGARLRCATASKTAVVAAYAYGGNAQPASWWCGQSVTEIGITATSSIGTNHTSGNSGAFSAWTNLGSTTPAPCGAVQFAIQGGALTVMSALAYYFEFGAGSTRIGPTIYHAGSTTEAVGTTATGPIFCKIPSGTELQVRGTCSGTAQALDVAAYVVH